MTEELQFDKVEEEIFIPTYELDICVRDGAGNPTGRRRYFRTHKPSSLVTWFFKNSLPPSRRRKRNKKSKK